MLDWKYIKIRQSYHGRLITVLGTGNSLGISCRKSQVKRLIQYPIRR